MAANVRVHAAPGWADREILTPTQINALQLQAAQAPNRNSTASGTRRHPFLPVETYAATGPTRIAIPINGTLSMNNQATVDMFLNLLELPHGQVLNSVTVHAHPAGGHGGQPAVLPSIVVYKIAGATASSLGTGTHAWADIATYELGFNLAATALAHTIDRHTYTYLVKFIPESGVNSVDGLILQYMDVSATIDHAEGGVDLSLWI